MADRVKAEADAKEAIYKAEFKEWESECKVIENENEGIRTRNKNRENWISEATKQFESETANYERALRDYQDKMEQRKVAMAAAVPDETGYTPEPPPAPLEPDRPSSLDSRIDPIKRDHPLEEEKSFPPEPQPEPTLRFYV